LESEASLNEEEESILKEFEKNDEELEDIANQICGALDQLKGTAQNMEKLVDDQGKLLKKVNKSADGLEVSLQQENNALKNVIAKHKGCKQLCFDLCLLIFFLLLLGVLLKILEYKGYI